MEKAVVASHSSKIHPSLSTYFSSLKKETLLQAFDGQAQILVVTKSEVQELNLGEILNVFKLGFENIFVIRTPLHNVMQVASTLADRSDVQYISPDKYQKWLIDPPKVK